jgi:hypothetical protein
MMDYDEHHQGWRVPKQVLQDENDRLRGEIETLRRERDEALAAQGYLYIGRDGKPILARDLEDQRDALRALLREAASALEPFAAIERRQWAGTVYEGAADDKGILYHYESKTCVTVGDFRRASAVLEKIKIEIDNIDGQKKD